MLSTSQSNQTSFSEKRQKKGVCIAVAGDSIKRLSKNLYKVRSQSGNGWYKITRTEDADIWSCTCPDFSYNLVRKEDKRCKHIRAVQTLQHTFETANKIEKVERMKICPRCLSTDAVKNGFRIVKSGIKRQRYECRKCSRDFILGENGFSKISSDPKIIAESLNLVFSGMSYRNVARHLKLTYGRSWSHVAIKKWIDKYCDMIGNYVDTLKPELGDVWHVDEIMLNIKDTKRMGKGFYSWCWNTLDGSSRFVLASELSKRREIADANHAFAKGKENANGTLPSYVVTDCLQTYKKAFIAEFNARAVMHIKTKSLSEGFENRPVERYHNEVRAVIKARRGLGNDESAQKFVDGYRHYHNFVRPHTGLPGNQTPAEAAGIDLKLAKENPMKDLIVKAATAIQKDTRPEMFVINQLGKRYEKLAVINEKDCIKFKQKRWIEKQEWREINDILRVNGFSWLSNGKDSCWIRMQG
jgi:transposase-like protein